MLIKIFASGTNVQRLAKSARGHVDGVIYSAYSQLEQTEPGIVKRRFFASQVASLAETVDEFDAKIQPSWIKIWGKPNANKAFVEKLFTSLVGDDSLRPELNLSEMAGEPVQCFMLLVSANNAEMAQIKKIANNIIPDWHVKVLNGDNTTNFQAGYETTREINEAKIAGKRGVIIIANQMGSRSYSVPEIQATVVAYDRGGVDATTQKVSRCLTPGDKWDGSDKTEGLIVDLSFDPNRSEIIERIVLEEALMVQKAEGTDFPAAVKYVLTSIDLFKVNEFGFFDEVAENEMFTIFGDNDVLLKVADMSAGINILDVPGAVDIIMNVKTSTATTDKQKKIAAATAAINSVTKGEKRELTPKEQSAVKELEALWNEVVRALNMSATSVWQMTTQQGNSYRECLGIISSDARSYHDFGEVYGVSPAEVIELLDAALLSEPLLDVIVQNSKSSVEIW